MKTIKLVVVAAAFGLTAPALAGNSGAVKLSDAELDNITAGSAMVSTAVLNPGNASVMKVNGTNIHIVGLPEGVENPFDGGKARVLMVVNPARTVFKCSASVGGVSSCP
jgi:hypothetical protein